MNPLAQCDDRPAEAGGPSPSSRLGMTTDAEVREVYLAPGQFFFSTEPAEVVMVLGSCVAVGMWDEVTGAGGITHFLLPRWTGGSKLPKYGDIANTLLLARFERAGIPVRRLRAKVFGGGCVMESMCAGGNGLGVQNVEVARRFLTSHRISVVAQDVCGRSGMRLSFWTSDGAATVRRLRS